MAVLFTVGQSVRIPQASPGLVSSQSSLRSQFNCCCVSFSSSCSLSSSSLPSAKLSRRFIPRVSSTASVTGLSENIGEILGDVSIFTAGGEPVMFKDLWNQNEGIAVVALLRHFGCPCCWELASALKESKARFDGAGVKLIAVGVGAPNKARILGERVQFLFTLAVVLARFITAGWPYSYHGGIRAVTVGKENDAERSEGIGGEDRSNP